MITIKRLNKKYDDQIIFEDAECSFPSRGLVGIIGRSGEGKSTLLNILALLDLDYEGEIALDNCSYHQIKNLEEYRFNNFGFIFQNYSLFNLLSIKDNVIIGASENQKIDDIYSILKKVNLKIDKNKCVSFLSGGEKQKVAIARALFNSPRVLFCDEPTGALDEENKHVIMSLLKEISKDILVILVSHEIDLIRQYCDSLYEIKNHKIIMQYSLIDDNRRIDFNNNRNHLNLKYMLSYVKSNIKNKKYRSTISTFSISMGLVCIGISLILTSIVSDNIKISLTAFMNDESVIIKPKEQNDNFNEIYSAPETTLVDMKNDYRDYVQDIGVFYFSDFETQFPQSNYCSFTSGEYEVIFSELSVRAINEFLWVEDVNNIYPLNPGRLENDEIILRLRKKDIKRINNALSLKDDSPESLSEYLLNNDLHFSFHLQNNDWDYKDELFFYSRHFVIDDEIGFIHSNHRWNEDIYEELMRFKSSDDLISLNPLPWTFKKVFYLKTSKSSQTYLTQLLLEDEKYQEFSFDYIDSSNSYTLVDEGEKSGRIYVTNHTNQGLKISEIKKFCEQEKAKSILLSVPSTYIIIGELMINGFTRATFLSQKTSDLDTINDLYTITEINVNQQPLYQEGLNIIYGGLADINNKDNLKFKPIIEDDLLIGREPQSYKEIVISSRVARQLYINSDYSDVLNKTIYFSFVRNSRYDGTTFYNEFVQVPLTIVGIVNEDINAIYHTYLWNMFFYAENAFYPLSELKIDSFMVNMNKKVTQKNCDILSQKYNKYEIFNPSLNLESSINEVVNYIDLTMFAFSFIAIISSILMSVLVIYLFIVENKREIGLLKALGISKISIRMMFLIFSLTLGIMSFIYSDILLVINELAISYSLSSSLEYFSFKAFFKASGFMLFTILIICSLVGFISSNSAIRYDPVKVLKEK